MMVDTELAGKSGERTQGGQPGPVVDECLPTGGYRGGKLKDGARVPLVEPRFTMGIEEEYLLVDLETRDLVQDPPPDVMAESQSRLLGQVGPEFLRSQIEVGTKVCSTIQEARTDLARLRSNVADVAGKHGMGLIAASTSAGLLPK